MSGSNSLAPSSTVRQASSALLNGASLLTTTASASNLKVRRMTLFANGLCNYELSSKVVGDATLSLTIESHDMSKLLSSLTVVDLSGRGMISSISYESPGYNETIRQEIGPGLQSSDRVFSALLKDAVGTRVAVEPRGGSSKKNLEGILLGVERGVGRNAATFSLVLLIDGFEVRCADMLDVKNVRFHSGGIHKQFAMFSALKSRRHSKTKKRVVIKAKGEGVRSISANFLASMPTWKTSYRFLISPRSVLIQGWAVIDNITDQDLENVELTLVSEVPMPLGRDLYMPQSEGPVSGEKEEISQLRRRLTGTRIQDKEEQQENGPSEIVLKESNNEENIADDDLRSSASTPTPGRVQNYEHKIANSVSIRRFQSALIPVIFSECYGGRVGLYNCQKSPDHVLSAVQILNSTKTVLEAGPVTIFDDGAYVGEAVLPRCLPDQMNFLPYSRDKAFVVKRPEVTEVSKFAYVKVVDGELQLGRTVARTTTYHFTNLGSFEADLHLEHCLKNEGLSVVSCLIDENKTIEPRMTKGKTVQYLVHFNPEQSLSMVIQERTAGPAEVFSATSSESLAELTDDDITNLAKDGIINESQASSLWGMFAFNQRKLKVNAKLLRLKTTELRLKEREKKTRSDMEALKHLDKDTAGEVTVRYIKKLDVIDDELEKTFTHIQTYHDELGRIVEELSEAVRSFPV